MFSLKCPGCMWHLTFINMSRVFLIILMGWTSHSCRPQVLRSTLIFFCQILMCRRMCRQVIHVNHTWITTESCISMQVICESSMNHKYRSIYIYDISTSRCKARLSPAFLPDRCCAPGWTTPQLLTFGRLDASLQRCQVFFKRHFNHFGNHGG